MKIYPTYSLAISLFAGIALSATALNAATLQVDIQSSGTNTSDAITQSGWNAWELSETFGTSIRTNSFSYASATGGSLDVSLNTTTGAGARNYGLDGVTDPGNLSNPNVWADLFFFNNNDTGSLTLTLDNLLAGNYSITTYHFADDLAVNVVVGQDPDNGIADISVNGVDTGQNASFLVANRGTSGEEKTAAQLEASARTIAFSVANDGDSVAILFDGLDTNGGGDSFGINGFTIIPEPATSALLFGLIGFGGAVFLRRRM